MCAVEAMADPSDLMLTRVSEAEVVELMPDQLGEDALGRFGQYWYALKDQEGGVPDRAAFDPARVMDLLANVIIVEHLGDGDFLYRLLGTGVDHFTRAAYTGLRTSEIAGHGPGNRIHTLFSTAIGAERPVGTALPYVGERSVCKSVRQIAAPFCVGAEPGQIISVIEFELRENTRPALVDPRRRKIL